MTVCVSVRLGSDGGGCNESGSSLGGGERCGVQLEQYLYWTRRQHLNGGSESVSLVRRDLYTDYCRKHLQICILHSRI